MVLRTFETFAGEKKIGLWTTSVANDQNVSNLKSIQQIFEEGSKSGKDFNVVLDDVRKHASTLGEDFNDKFSLNFHPKDYSQVTDSLKEVESELTKTVSLKDKVKTTFSSIGQSFQNLGKTVVTGIANMGIWAAISMATDFVLKQVTNAITATSRAAEEAAGRAKTYNEDKTSIDDYRTQINELYKSLENDNLSTQEAYNVRQQLSSIQDEVIEKFGKEAEALNLLTESSDQANETLDKMSKQKSVDYLAENAQAIKNAQKYWTESFDISTWKWTPLQHQFSLDNVDKESIQQIREIAKRNNVTLWNDYLSGGYEFRYEGTRDEFETKWKKMQEELSDYAIKLKGKAESEVNEALSYANDTYNYVIDDNAKNQREVLDTATEATIEKYDNLREFDQKIKDKLDEYNDAVLKDDPKAIQSAVDEMEKLRSEFESLTYEGEGTPVELVKKHFEEQLDEIQKVSNKEKVRILFENDDQSLDNLKKQVEDVKPEIADLLSKDDFNISFLGDDQTVIDQYSAIKEAAEGYGVSVADLISILQEYGYCIDQNTYKHQQLDRELSNYKTAVADVTQTQEAVTSALNEQSKGTIALDTYTGLKMLLPELDDALESNGAYLTLNYDKLKQLQNEKANATKADLQQAIAAESAEWARNAQEISNAMSNYANLSEEEQKELQAKVQLNQAISDQITQYDVLISKLNYATSGYKAWLDAQSAPDTGDINDAAVNAAKHLDKVFNYDEGSASEYGRYNSVVAKGAEQFIIPQDVIDKGYDAMGKYFNGIKQYLTGDASAVQAFYDAMVEKGLASYDELEGYKIKPGVDTSDIESQMHMTREVVTGLLGESEEFGFTISFADEDVTAAIAKVQELQSAEAELNAAKLKPEVDTTEMENKVEKLKAEVKEIPDEVLIEAGVTVKDDKIQVDEKKLNQTITLTYNKSDTEKLIEDYRNINDQIREMSQGNNVDKSKLAPLIEEAAQYENQLRSLPDGVKELYDVNENLMDSGAGIASLSETVKDYQTALAAAADANSKLKEAEKGGMKLDSSAYKTLAADAQKANQDAENLKNTLSDLSSSGKIPIDLDIDQMTEQLQAGTFDFESIKLPVETEASELETQITSIEQRIATLQDAKVNFKGDTSEIEALIPTLEARLSNLQAQVVIKADDNASSVVGTVSDEIAKLPKLHSTDLKAVAHTAPITTFKNELDTIPTKKTTTITTRRVTENITKKSSSSGGTHELNGTAHVFGTALSSGSWGAKQTSTALTGELGQELVVRGNRWFTVGDNGAEFVKIQKGDVVFNHKQTESLLKNGYVTGRGQSYVDGTAYVIGGGKLPTIPVSQTSSNSSNKAASTPTTAKRDTTTKTAKGKTALEKLLESYSKLYDWIVIKLDRVAKKTDAKIDKIDEITNKSLDSTYKKTKKGKKVRTSKGQLAYIDDAISATQSEINVNEKAAARYMKQAQKVAVQTGLWNSTIKKIHNGTINISSYGEIDQKKISEYKKWYDAAQGCLETITELNKQEHELKIRRLENIQNYYENRADRYADQFDLKQGQVDLLETQKTDEGKLFTKNDLKAIKSNYKSMQSNLTQQQKLSNDEAKRLQKELDKQVKSKNIKKNSDEWFEWTANINAAKKAAQEAKTSIEELNNAQSQLIFDNLQTYYGNRTDYRDSRIGVYESEISLKEAIGKKVTSKDYAREITEQNEKLKKQRSEYSALIKQRDALIKAGTIKKYSTEWYEWTNAIQDANAAIKETRAEITTLSQTKFEINLTNLNHLLDRISAVRDILEKRMDLHETQGYDLTIKEYVNLIKNADNAIDNYNKQIAQYQKEIKTLGYKSGSEKWEEIQLKIRDCQSAVLDLMISQEQWNDSIVDIRIKELEKQREEFEKMNDAKDKQLKLEKALEALEKARSQRTKLVYREGQGFVYEADQDAVKKAQEDLNDIYYQDVLDKFDEAIEALEDLKKDDNLYNYDFSRHRNTKYIEKGAPQTTAKNIVAGVTTAVNQYNKQHFASGSKSVPRSGLSIVDEVRPELISRGRYTWLEKGDTVFPANITDNLWGFGSNPEKFLQDHLKGLNMSDVKVTSQQTHNTNVNITGGLSFPNITNESSAKEIVNELNNIALKATQRVRRD